MPMPATRPARPQPAAPGLASSTRPTPSPARPSSPALGEEKLTFSESSGVELPAHRIGIYGPGGVGKTTLAAAIAETGHEPFFYDLDGGAAGLGVPHARLGDRHTIDTWAELIGALAHEPYHKSGRVHIVDTASRAEELAAQHIIRTYKIGDSKMARSVSDYSWGKGGEYMYDTMLLLFGALDAIWRKGQSVIVICHDTTSSVTNPSGEDFLQFQPRLQPPSKKGSNSVRHKLLGWSDCLIFVQFDIFVGDSGKAINGTPPRTLRTVAGSTFWAKSRVIPGRERSLPDAVAFERHTAGEFWSHLFGEIK